MKQAVTSSCRGWQPGGLHAAVFGCGQLPTHTHAPQAREAPGHRTCGRPRAARSRDSQNSSALRNPKIAALAEAAQGVGWDTVPSCSRGKHKVKCGKVVIVQQAASQTSLPSLLFSPFSPMLFPLPPAKIFFFFIFIDAFVFTKHEENYF